MLNSFLFIQSDRSAKTVMDVSLSICSCVQLHFFLICLGNDYGSAGVPRWKTVFEMSDCESGKFSK